jgi:hypothetical protein
VTPPAASGGRRSTEALFAATIAVALLETTIVTTAKGAWPASRRTGQETVASATAAAVSSRGTTGSRVREPGYVCDVEAIRAAVTLQASAQRVDGIGSGHPCEGGRSGMGNCTRQVLIAAIQNPVIRADRATHAGVLREWPTPT